MEDKETADGRKSSQSLQLKNLLKSFSNRYTSPYARFKIRNITSTYNGEVFMELERLSKVRILLGNFYQLEVERRGAKMQKVDTTVVDRVMKYLVEPDSKPWLVLYGTVGTGKTTMMRAIQLTIQFLYEDQTDRPTTSSIKANKLGEMAKKEPEAFKKAKGCTILYIDDLGFSGEGEINNDYGVRRRPIEEIIENRYDRMLATIFTTNLTIDQIQDRYGERIASRLYEMSMFVPMTGDDLRKNRETLTK